MLGAGGKSQWAVAAYELLVWSAWCVGFLLHGVSRGDLKHVIPYLGIITVYQIAAHFAGQRPGFFDAKSQLFRAHVEALFTLISIYNLDGWATPIWLLLQIPMLEVARIGRLKLIFLFGLEVLFASGLLHLKVMGVGLISLLSWSAQVGYLLMAASAVCFFVSQLYSASRPISALSHSRIDAHLSWDSVAWVCCGNLGADRVRLLFVKPLSGTISQVADVDFRVGQLNSGGRKEFPEIKADIEALEDLSEKSFVIVQASTLGPSVPRWILPARAETTYIMVAKISGLGDTQLTGFLVAEYSAKSLWGWEVGIKPGVAVLSSLNRLVVATYEEVQSRERSEFFARTAASVLKAGTIEAASLALAGGLMRFFGTGCVVWREISPGGTVLAPLVAEGTQVFPELRIDFMPGDRLLEPFVVSAHDGGRVEHELLMGAAAAMYLTMGEVNARKTILAVYSFPRFSSRESLKNLGNLLLASELIPTFRLALMNLYFKDQEGVFERLRREVGRLSVGQGEETLLSELARVAGISLDFQEAIWFFPAGEDLKLGFRWYRNSRCSDGDFKPPEGLLAAVTDSVAARRCSYLELGHLDSRPLNAFVPVFPAIGDPLCLVLTGHEMHRLYGHDNPDLDILALIFSKSIDAERFTSLLRREKSTLEELGELAKDILEESKIRKILAKAVEAAWKLTQSDLAAILLVHPEDSKFITVEACDGPDFGEVDFLGRRIGIGQGVTGFVAQAQIPRRVDDVAGLDGSRFISLFEGTRSELAVPLLGGEDRIFHGVLNLESRHLAHYNEGHVHLAEKLATQISIALQQASRIERLEAVQECLEQTVGLAMIGLFYGEDIHFTGNKLGAARQFARVIQRDDCTLEDAKKKAVYIEHNVGLVLDLVWEIRRSVQAVNPERFDLSEVIDDSFLGVIKASGASSILVPKISVEDSFVEGFSRQLGQIFRVLFKNSIDAMFGRGSVTVFIDEFWKDGLEFMKVCVVDEGAGIQPALLERMFSLNKPVTSEGKGFGIGLAWCRLFLSMYGGEIWAESEVSKGTTMTLLIPRNVRRTAGAMLLEGSR